jgi:hypothetical protein
MCSKTAKDKIAPVNDIEATWKSLELVLTAACHKGIAQRMPPITESGSKGFIGLQVK